MNKQPFYHVASVLFTATRRIDRDEFEKALKKAFESIKTPGLLKRSLECEQIGSEAGDPADLVS
jgi:hypothetical protein